MASKTKLLPTIDRLKELLVYNPLSGELRWKVGRPGASAGAIAGSLTNKGYIVVRIDGCLIVAHRVVWAISHGRWPTSDLDHRDTVKTNNRLVNLREATMSQNIANSGLCQSNTSGIKGVTWDQDRGLWHAQITFQGRNIFLGRFADKGQAGAAYAAKASELFGEFARAA